MIGKLNRELLLPCLKVNTDRINTCRYVSECFLYTNNRYLYS